jgi:hypothetical protein
MAEAPATIGLAPHSGWAALVALAGPKTAPRVVLRERLEMTSPKLAGPKQPYHEVEPLPVAPRTRCATPPTAITSGARWPRPRAAAASSARESSSASCSSARRPR